MKDSIKAAKMNKKDKKKSYNEIDKEHFNNNFKFKDRGHR